jgi:hypothetical protein
MDICLLWVVRVVSGKGPYVGPIIRLEESYWLRLVIVRDQAQLYSCTPAAGYIEKISPKKVGLTDVSEKLAAKTSWIWSYRSEAHSYVIPIYTAS